MPETLAKPPNKEKVQLNFGAAVRARRLDLAMTQERLAELADLHTNYISSVERGERNLRLYNIARVAFALNLPAAVLLSSLDGS